MIHVILSISSGLVRQAIRQELEDTDDISVVAEVSSPMELLCCTELKQADAVLLDAEEGTEMPGVVTHLFAEFPKIVALVVGRRGDHAIVYRQQLCEQIYEGVSLAQVLKELRTADTGYWSRTNR